MKIINRIIDSTLIFWWRLLDLLGAPTSVIRGPLPTALADLSPESAGLAYEDVQIGTDLGWMPAWLVPAVDSNKWIIFIHGRGGARVGSLDMLPMLHQLGYNSLVITHRNDYDAPKSPDGLDHLGSTEWRDLEAAVEYAIDFGAEHVSIFARSAGAQVAGQFLTQSNYGPFVDRMILDNPVLDWTAVFMNQRPKWLPKVVARLIIWGNARKIGARMSQFSWAKNPPIDQPPTLIIHTTDDEVCPVGVSRQFARTRPSDWNVVLVEFSIGGHAGARFEEQARYLHLVRNWLAPGQAERLALPSREEVSA